MYKNKSPTCILVEKGEELKKKYPKKIDALDFHRLLSDKEGPVNFTQADNLFNKVRLRLDQKVRSEELKEEEHVKFVWLDEALDFVVHLLGIYLSTY